MILLYFLTAAATAVFAVYLYYLRQSQYWSRRGVPGPRALPFYGNIKEINNFQSPFLLKIYEWTKEFGKVYGYKEGLRNVLVTSDVEMLNEVFVKQFDAFYARRAQPLAQDADNNPRVHLFEAKGARWKRLRALVTPALSINSLKKMQPIMDDSAAKLADLMEERHGNGESFNVARFTAEYSLDVICRLVIGQKESKLFENPRLLVLKAIFQQNLDNTLTHIACGCPPLGRAIRNWHARSNKQMSKVSTNFFTEIESTVVQRMEERSRTGPPSIPVDFIDLLLDSENDEFEYRNQGEFSSRESITKALTVDEVIAQSVIVMLGGWDTVSNALAYTLWMLSRNSEVMKRCQDEVDEVCASPSISYDDCHNMRYVDTVIKETLRIFPFGSRSVSRTCMRNINVCGYNIEEGTIVLADAYAVHRSKELWGEDADVFRPERWLESDKRAATNFLTFGSGPRVCIGMRLAPMETKIALAHLLRRFDVLADEQVSELKLLGSLAMFPEEAPIKIKRRV